MAPRQATLKGTAKKVAKVFASKTVKDVMEKVITTSIEREKLNKKTVTASNIADTTISAVLIITSIIKSLQLVIFFPVDEMGVQNEIERLEEIIRSI